MDQFFPFQPARQQSRRDTLRACRQNGNTANDIGACLPSWFPAPYQTRSEDDAPLVEDRFLMQQHVSTIEKVATNGWTAPSSSNTHSYSTSQRVPASAFPRSGYGQQALPGSTSLADYSMSLPQSSSIPIDHSPAEYGGPRFLPISTARGSENLSAVENEAIHEPSMVELLHACLRQAPGYTMKLADIYTWLHGNSQRVQSATDKQWHNTVRHNLSQNDAFERVRIRISTDSEKTVGGWRLASSVVDHGVIYPTTRYRKNNCRSRTSERQAPLAPSRQRAGAKGGNATRDYGFQHRRLSAHRRPQLDASGHAIDNYIPTPQYSRTGLDPNHFRAAVPLPHGFGNTEELPMCPPFPPSVRVLSQTEMRPSARVVGFANVPSMSNGDIVGSHGEAAGVPSVSADPSYTASRFRQYHPTPPESDSGSIEAEFPRDRGLPPRSASIYTGVRHHPPPSSSSRDVPVTSSPAKIHRLHASSLHAHARLPDPYSSSVEQWQSQYSRSSPPRNPQGSVPSTSSKSDSSAHSMSTYAPAPDAVVVTSHVHEPVQNRVRTLSRCNAAGLRTVEAESLTFASHPSDVSALLEDPSHATSFSSAASSSMVPAWSSEAHSSSSLLSDLFPLAALRRGSESFDSS